MQFNVAQVLKETVGSTRAYPIDDMTMDDSGFTSRVVGDVAFLRTDKGILVTASVKRDQRYVCSRCLTDFSAELAFSFNEEFLPTVDILTGLPMQLSEEDSESFTIDEQHVLDVSEAIRQYSIVRTPMKPLCSPDCHGLCPGCGANLNVERCDCLERIVDPRWTPLLSIRRKVRS